VTDDLQKDLVRGFARFVLKQGRGATCPTPHKNNQPKTWQQRGRELYGAELFNSVLREEIERMKQEANGTRSGG